MPKGVKKREKYRGVSIRHVLATNVRELMKLRWPDSPNRSASLEKECKSLITDSTIQRILVSESGVSVDQLELIAKAFNLEPYQLLIHGLDVRKPQKAAGAKALPKRSEIPVTT